MKYSIWIGLTLGLSLGLMWAGISGDLSLNANGVVKQGRITVIESESYNWNPKLSVAIIDVDGVEYLVNYHGGICPLDKKGSGE